MNQREPAVTHARDTARKLLEEHHGEIDLAMLHVERKANGSNTCSTRLFGRGLAHMSGFAEHSNVDTAVELSVRRALLALMTDGLHNPWTSPPPSSQRGARRA